MEQEWRYLNVLKLSWTILEIYWAYFRLPWGCRGLFEAVLSASLLFVRHSVCDNVLDVVLAAIVQEQVVFTASVPLHQFLWFKDFVVLVVA